MSKIVNSYKFSTQEELESLIYDLLEQGYTHWNHGDKIEGTKVYLDNLEDYYVAIFDDGTIDIVPRDVVIESIREGLLCLEN